MDYIKERKINNAEIEERYLLAKERIYEIEKEVDEKNIFFKYIQKVVKGFINVFEFLEKREDETELDLAYYNELFYRDLLDSCYETSPCNPDFTFSILEGKTNNSKTEKELAQILAFLASECRACSIYAYEYRKDFITIVLELFIECYLELNDYRMLKETMYFYAFDYADVFTTQRIKEQINPQSSFGTYLVKEKRFETVDDLYLYGEYITNDEIKLFEFINSLDKLKVEKIASTYVNAYYTGFVKAGKPIDKKEYVNIRYHIGMERIVKRAIELFEEKGLKPIIYRRGISLHAKKSVYRVGYTGAIANPQYDYDHRNDKAIILDKKYAKRIIEVTKNTFEEYKELASKMAGPAVIETFGEEPFNPIGKDSVPSFSEQQEKIEAEESAELFEIVNKYIVGEERSFTIIAFPLPTIGKDFEEIFEETLKLNTLDSNLYEKIQKNIIDTLDIGEKVIVKGKGDNITDLEISLAILNNPEKETIFENCVADVNIPVGEVFTSPKLEGTNGTLNVTSVYLNGLLYKNLKIVFKDGMIQDYSCDVVNDEKNDNGKQYIKETLLKNRETLPMGEFAIGTNTTAYVMSHKYKIEKRMPILIAEKCGPHFAIGDTCYSHEEDVKVFNSDGKEIIAKENSVSALRKSEPEKAYFQCHTDITVPYDELGELSVITKNKEKIEIIKDGKFVLDGTQELNKPFKE